MNFKPLHSEEQRIILYYFLYLFEMCVVYCFLCL